MRLSETRFQSEKQKAGGGLESWLSGRALEWHGTCEVLGSIFSTTLKTRKQSKVK